MNQELPTPSKPDQEPSMTSDKPAKIKKPPTEKQLEARAKGLAVMTARRKEIKEEKEKKKEQIKVAKKVVEDKILKEDLGFVNRQEYENTKNGLMKEIGELKAMLKIQHEQPKPAPAKQERIVERIVERVPTPSAQPTKLTGHALLDKLFFEK